MGEEHNSEVNNASLNSLEIDTIGEILNISMGSAATAISQLLDKQVIISTPTVELREFNAMDYVALEPAMLVKISYVEGLAGSNVMIFRQQDMQIILNLMMGNTDEPTEEFVFDELSMSAACELMNQMMGASATALSEFLSRVVNISTPEARTVGSDNGDYAEAVGVREGDEIVAVSFRLNIDGVMDSSFASIFDCALVKDIVGQVIGDQDMAAFEESSAAATAPAPAAPTPMPTPAPAAPQPPVQQAAPAAPATPQMPTPAPAAPQPPIQEAMPAAPQMPPMPQMPQQPPMPYPPQPMPGMDQQQAYGAYGYPPYYGYPGYPPYPPYPQQPPVQPQQEAPNKPAVNVQNPQFPQFNVQNSSNPNTNGNMDLLMGVSLDVSVEIGKTKRKIKDIIEFGQGSVIELNKQAGAPVDIVVNGRLLARGDVVVIDDNFGVRITEILGTKELMESLKEEMM